MHSRYAQGAALFDPVSLRVLYLSQAETLALTEGKSDILSELHCLGFFTPNSYAPVAIDASSGDIIPLAISDYSENYEYGIRRRFEEEGITGEVFSLAGFRIVVTDRCNMKCSYCFVDTNTGARDITLTEIENGLDLLIALKDSRSEITYQWFGGEPLLRYDLIMPADNVARSKASKLGLTIRPTVVTNGTVLNDQLIEHFREFNYGVGISLDGPPEINNVERRLRSGKTTEHIIEKNVQRLLNANIHVGANVTPTAGNCHQIIETVKYVLNLGVKFIYVNSPIPIRGYWLNDGAAWAKALYEARMFAFSHGAMLFSHLDRVYQAIDSRMPRAFEHKQEGGGLNAALLPGNRLSVLDLNWRVSEYIFSLNEIRENPALLSTARKKLYPSAGCQSCMAAGICGGPSINDRLLIGNEEPLSQYCDFFRTATRIVALDTTGLQ